MPCQPVPPAEAQGRGGRLPVDRESSSSTMKTKAEGVLRLGPNVRQAHTVKDQKGPGPSGQIPSAHWLCRAAGGLTVN